jgi:hypothetical protein
MDTWIFQFAAKVWWMRKHQKAWFLDHGLQDLSEAKRYEAAVDKELRTHLVVENGEPRELKLPPSGEQPAEPKQSSMFAEGE